MLIVVGAAKGSPGASTTALALAARWPRPALLVEADPSGADLIYSLLAPGRQAMLTGQRTIMQMAASSPHAITPALVHAYTQVAEGDLRVLLGPPDPTQAGLAARCWPALARVLTNLPGTDNAPMDVIVDAGRWSESPVHEELAAAASQLVTVAWPTAGDLRAAARLRDRVNLLTAWRGRAGAMPLRVNVVVRTPLRGAKSVLGQAQRDLADLKLPADVLGPLGEERNPPVLLGGQLGRGDLAKSAAQLVAALATRPAAPSSGPQAMPAQVPGQPGPPSANPLAATQTVQWGSNR